MANCSRIPPTHFNPRFPCGERQPPAPETAMPVNYFNPRPPCGGDRKSAQVWLALLFKAEKIPRFYPASGVLYRIFLPKTTLLRGNFRCEGGGRRFRPPKTTSRLLSRSIMCDADAFSAVKPVIQDKLHCKFYQRRDRRGISLCRFPFDRKDEIIFVVLA